MFKDNRSLRRVVHASLQKMALTGGSVVRIDRETFTALQEVAGGDPTELINEILRYAVAELRGASAGTEDHPVKDLRRAISDVYQYVEYCNYEGVDTNRPWTPNDAKKHRYRRSRCAVCEAVYGRAKEENVGHFIAMRTRYGESKNDPACDLHAQAHGKICQRGDGDDD